MQIWNKSSCLSRKAANHSYRWLLCIIEFIEISLQPSVQSYRIHNFFLILPLLSPFPFSPYTPRPRKLFPKPGHSIPSKPKVWLITCESPPYGAGVERCWSSGRSRSEWLLWILCTFYRFYPIRSPCSYIILQPESLQIRIKQHHGIFLSFYFWETHFIPISLLFCRKAHVAMSKNKGHLL